MKMTLIEAINRQRILVEFANKKLPYKLAYAISKNLVKLQSEVEIIEASRKNIIDTYSVKDENGESIVEDNHYKIEDGKVEEFNAEIQNLMLTETEVDITTVPESVLDLDDSRFDALTVAQIVALDFMIEQ